MIFSCHSGEKDENGEHTTDKDKEVIIISNSKESIDPKEDLESEEKEPKDLKSEFCCS